MHQIRRSANKRMSISQLACSLLQSPSIFWAQAISLRRIRRHRRPVSSFRRRLGQIRLHPGAVTSPCLPGNNLLAAIDCYYWQLRRFARWMPRAAASSALLRAGKAESADAASAFTNSVRHSFDYCHQEIALLVLPCLSVGVIFERVHA